MILPFFNGLFLGFGLVAPLGPQNTFILTAASTQKKFISSLPILLTAILCDLFLILTAVFGMNLISQFPILKPFLLVSGILFLFYISINNWKASNQIISPLIPVKIHIAKQILYTLSVSLLNPHALLDAFIVIGSVSSEYLGIEKSAFTVGCVVIDILWFFSLAAIGCYIGTLKTSLHINKIINRISSIIMAIIATAMTVNLINTGV